MGAYGRHVEPEQHTVGKAHTQKIESKHINLRTLIKVVCPTNLHRHLLRMQVRQHRVLDVVQLRLLFFNSFVTVLVLTCNTRAVSRIPLAFMAISTMCCLTSGD